MAWAERLLCMKNKRDHVELSKIIKHYIIRMWKPAGFHILAYFKQIKFVLPWKTLNQKQRYKMDKREDLELLELQELALRHQSVCPGKSLEEKCMIVKAYLTNHVPITQLLAPTHVVKQHDTTSSNLMYG